MKLNIRKYLIKFYRNIMKYLPIKVVIYLDHLLKQKRIPKLKNPKSFTEKMQWIKLYGRLERYGYLVDKYSVREYVKNTIGSKYLNEIYGVYDNIDEINFDLLPEKFVMKLNNGSGYNLICKSKNELDEIKTKKILKKWMKVDFYKEHKEMQYKNIISNIIIEKYLEDDSGELKDYKIFCFDGKPEFIQVDSDRFLDHIQNIYNLNWNKLNLTFGQKGNNLIDKKPEKLKEMLYLAERLSDKIPFARIDFYYVENNIYFGEITITPQNGLVNFSPESEDYRIANMIDLEKYK